MKKILQVDPDWKESWKGMPEYIQEDKSEFSTLLVHFATKKDREKFAQLIEQKITHKTKLIWYPQQIIFHGTHYEYCDSKPNNKKIVKRRG